MRLRALTDAPHAFASTHAREVAFDEAGWRRRIEGGPWWLARVDGIPVGLVAGYPGDDDPADLRRLVAMWVDPRHRGTATATELVQTVCDWARTDGARVVSLWVTDGNVAARRLYERLGFVGTVECRPLPSDSTVGTERLERVLRP